MGGTARVGGKGWDGGEVFKLIRRQRCFGMHGHTPFPGVPGAGVEPRAVVVVGHGGGSRSPLGRNTGVGMVAGYP